MRKNKIFASLTRFKVRFKFLMIIATLMTTFVFWQTNTEMKKQRESAYKPALSINKMHYDITERMRFFGFGTTDTASALRIRNSLHLVSVKNLPKLEFKLANIGLGAAKNIKLECPASNYVKFKNWLDTTTESKCRKKHFSLSI